VPSRVGAKGFSSQAVHGVSGGPRGLVDTASQHQVVAANVLRRGGPEAICPAEACFEAPHCSQGVRRGLSSRQWARRREGASSGPVRGRSNVGQTSVKRGPAARTVLVP
jgi:hypothetical protein